MSSRESSGTGGRTHLFSRSVLTYLIYGDTLHDSSSPSVTTVARPPGIMLTMATVAKLPDNQKERDTSIPDYMAGDAHSESSFHSSIASSSEEPSTSNYPFYRLPTHPLILPSSVLSRKLKPKPFIEVWDTANVKSFIIEVMGPLPSTHNYHEGIHLCRIIFVDKYGFGRYMESMVLFWSLFHETYIHRDSDPHSASWSRWRHDRRLELEHVLCHSYVWSSDEGASYLEEYIDFRLGESGLAPTEEQEYLKQYGAKVTRFEVNWIGIESCNPGWADKSVLSRNPVQR